MELAIVFLIFIILTIITIFFGSYVFTNYKKKLWFITLTIDLLFALGTLSILFIKGLNWYNAVIILILNFGFVYLSGRYIIRKTIFNK